METFINYINDNYMFLLVDLGLSISIGFNIGRFVLKSKEEKIEIAKKQIKEIILKLVSDAEIEYEDYSSAGKIKRSLVISEIFKRYPILNRVVEQEKLIEWLDKEIDNSLDVLRKVVTNKM